MNNIPQIIHQMGPTDSSLWNSLWYHGQSEWKRIYPRFEYRFWTDDDIDSFMEDNYPKYVDEYRSLHLHIQQIDVARLFILHKFGGIYADLDYIPYKNFHRKLSNTFNIVGSTSHEEIVQNCLMASPAGNDEILELIEYQFCKYYQLPKVENTRENVEIRDNYVLNTFGPGSMGEYIDKIDHVILPQHSFNAFGLAKVTNTVYGAHHLTGFWGNTTLDTFDCIDEFKETHLEWFNRNRHSFDINY